MGAVILNCDPALIKSLKPLVLGTRKVSRVSVHCRHCGRWACPCAAPSNGYFLQDPAWRTCTLFLVPLRILVFLLASLISEVLQDKIHYTLKRSAKIRGLKRLRISSLLVNSSFVLFLKSSAGTRWASKDAFSIQLN